MSLNNVSKNLKDFIYKNKALILIILFSLLIRGVFFYQVKPWEKEVVENKILISDAYGYHSLGCSIMKTGAFSSFKRLRTPGYPLFVAVFYYVFGVKVWVVLLAQLLLDVGTTIIVFFLAKILFKSKAASTIAAFLYSANLSSAFYTTRFLSEIPFTFVFALSVLLFVYALKGDKGPAWLLLAAFLMGVATQIRPILQYFILIPIFVLLLRKQKLLYKLRNVAVMFLAFAAVLAPWQFRNLIRFGDYSLTNDFGACLCWCNAAILKANVEKISLEEAREELLGGYIEGAANLTSLSEEWGQVSSELLIQIAKEYIMRHPWQYARLHLKGMINFFMGVGEAGIRDTFGLNMNKVVRADYTISISDRLRKLIRDSREEYFLVPILVLILLMEYVFVIIGAIVMWFRKQQRLYIVLFGLTMIYFPTILGIMGYGRFKVPIVPFYLVLSAFGMVESFNLIRRRYASSNGTV